MHVVVSAMGFVPGRAFGAETYLTSTLKALGNVRGHHRVTVLCSATSVAYLRQVVPDLEYASFALPLRLPQRLVLEHYRGDRFVRGLGADVVFAPLNQVFKTSIPTVLMVHDLMPIFYRVHFPKWWPLRMRVRQWLLAASVRRASAVMAPSASVAREVEAEFGFREGHVRVAPEGPGLVGDRGEAEMPELPAWRRTLLAAGSHLPHKDIATAIKAVARVCAEAATPSDGLGLVITGGAEAGTRSLKRLVRRLGIARLVWFSGHLSGRQVQWLYGRAAALIFPSRYEGFALPIAEAQRFGVPVIATDIPICRETSGGHAWFFPPGDAGVLAQHIRRLAGDSACVDEMVRAARRHVARLSWEEHARIVLRTCHEVARPC